MPVVGRACWRGIPAKLPLPTSLGTCENPRVLQPQGYYTFDDLFDALNVRAEFIEAEIEAGHLVSTITMHGNPWYRQDYVHRWLITREAEIAKEQYEMRKIKLELIGS